LVDALLELDAHRWSVLSQQQEVAFTAAFDEIFHTDGARVILTPFQAPRANAYAERFVRTARAECLDWLLILGPRHLERVLRSFVRPYGLPVPLEPQPPPATGTFKRRDRLGGVLHEYYRAAA
jgi:putative transposase